jgi:hypothetical protein
MSVISILFLIFKMDVLSHYFLIFDKDLQFEYFLKKGLGEYSNFFEFLNKQYSNLFFQMLACPFCLGFWLTVLAIPVFDLDWRFTFVSYFFVSMTWMIIENE